LVVILGRENHNIVVIHEFFGGIIGEDQDGREEKAGEKSQGNDRLHPYC